MVEFAGKKQSKGQEQTKREPNFENCDFRKIINELSQSKSIDRVFADFCKVSACALSAQTREKGVIKQRYEMYHRIMVIIGK